MKLTDLDPLPEESGLSAGEVRRPRPSRRWGAFAIGIGIVAISATHYVTSFHSVVFHEVFKRLYYVPIVVAAITAGSRGGLAASLFSTLLYLPHVALRWHAWPLLEVEQYGEALMFNVVGIVAGALADRLHAERDRYQAAVSQLQKAYATVKARTEERLRVDRLVTVGRIASGIAHEIRSPLGGVLGCLEILEADFSRGHPKREFFVIAKREIGRLESVVTEFLEFAQPAPPTSQAVDLQLVVQAAVRLARPTLACRGIGMRVCAVDVTRTAHVDAEQVQRALLNMMLASAPLLREGNIVLTIEQRHETAQITIELEGTAALPPVAEVFEPFAANSHSHGLALATARRLIENQGGAVRAEIIGGRLRYLVDVPAPGPAQVETAPPPPETASLKSIG